MSKRERAVVTLCGLAGTRDREYREKWSREFVDLLIDATLEELRVELMDSVLAPAERGVAMGGVAE